MSEELPVVDGDAPLQPVRDISTDILPRPHGMPTSTPSPTVQYVSLLDETRDAIVVHYGEIRHHQKELNWKMGAIWGRYLDANPDTKIVDVYQFIFQPDNLERYKKNLSYKWFQQCIWVARTLKYHKPPDDWSWRSLREAAQEAINTHGAAEAPPMDTAVSKQGTIEAEKIHQYVLDKVGQFWSRKDLQAIEGFLGIQVVDAVDM